MNSILTIYKNTIISAGVIGSFYGIKDAIEISNNMTKFIFITPSYTFYGSIFGITCWIFSPIILPYIFYKKYLQ
jgi:hypothetical protein